MDLIRDYSGHTQKVPTTPRTNQNSKEKRQLAQEAASDILGSFRSNNGDGNENAFLTALSLLLKYLFNLENALELQLHSISYHRQRLSKGKE